MPKPRTYPTLFNEAIAISVSFLAKQGFLSPNSRRGGSVGWNRFGVDTGSVSIVVSTYPESEYLELNYTCNNSPIKYRVQLVSVPSNLGKGVVWLFVCPSTGKRCRKLHFVGSYFYHRSAFKGCMYEKQAESKSTRYLDKTLGAVLRIDHLREQLNKKYFKRYYAGKPTKRFLKLTQQIKKAESLTYQEYEAALKMFRL